MVRCISEADRVFAMLVGEEGEPRCNLIEANAFWQWNIDFWCATTNLNASSKCSRIILSASL
jgi:hypothetical protein